MNWQNIYRTLKSDYVKLLPIMALAFYLAFIPHHNYPYLVHLDEWMHLAYTKAMLQAGSTTFIDPFYGEWTESLIGSNLGLGAHLRFGFYLFWGVFHQISGISWLTIFKYFPSLVFLITVLSVYVLAKRQGFGWEAALFTCLIPTTVGILGPGFLVPVAMGLLFFPLSLFIVFNFRTGWSYVVLFLFTCFLLAMHPVTAMGLVIILVPYIILTLKANFKHSLGMTLAIIVPFVGPMPWIFSLALIMMKSLTVTQGPAPWVDISRIILTYGYLPILFGLLGTFLLSIRGRNENYGLVLGLLALLLMLVTFFAFHYGVRFMYERGLMYMLLIMSIVAGAGLMWVKSLRLPTKLATKLKAPIITKNVGSIVCLIFIVITLAISIPSHMNTPYYYMIDRQDYEAFVWIKENLGDEYDKAILDPWKATPFTAITGKKVYTRLHAYPQLKDEIAYEFLKEGSTNTSFLRENDISIVYTRWESRNADLERVREKVYLLKEAREGE